MDEPNQQSPMVSPGRDVQRLKQNSTAAAGELKEFLGKIQGKSPKEMLGVVASSGLVQGLIQAAIAMVVLVLVLTVVPYGWGQMFGGSETTPPVQAEAANVAPEKPAEAQPQAPAADPNVAVPPEEMPANIADPAKAIDALGVGETKEAPANVNPLEGSADDLLKGLD